MLRRLSLLTLLAAAGATSPSAAQSTAQGRASVRVAEPAGIAIVQDVLANFNASLVVFGSVGDAVSMAVPANVSISGPGGESLVLATSSALSTSSLILAQDSISVSIGALPKAQPDGTAGTYGGIMVVLAQYN